MKIAVSSAAFTAVAMFMLAACGGGGGGSTPTPVPPPSDNTPPVTTLDLTPPALTVMTTLTFTFSANEVATFEVRFDGAAFAPATSPHIISNVGDGSHTFEVRARDGAGNFDPTPASFTLVIDTTPPETQITAAPSTTGPVNTSTFTVSGSEPGGTLEASVDGAFFAVVTSPHTVTNLLDGPHTIRFRARDVLGNVDASPATATWTLDATAPEVRLVFPTRNFGTDAATVSVRGTAQDPNGVVALSVNGVAVQTTDNFAHWSAVIPVPLGTTPVSVTSADGPGNTGTVGVSTMYNRGPFMNGGRGIGYDAVRDRIIYVDQSTGNIVAYRRADGIGRMLSAGPAPGAPAGILEELVIDALNDRALVIDTINDALIAVNLATGVRSTVSAGIGNNAPTSIYGASFLTLEAAAQQAYVSSAFNASVIRIDLATGARTVVSSNTVGGGSLLVNQSGIVYDNVTNPASPRLLICAYTSPGYGIVAIDLATGNRTVFSSGVIGGGDEFGSPVNMRIDPAGQRLLVNDNSTNSLVAVALASGNRTTINSFTVGTGPYASFHVGLTFDATNRRLFVAQSSGGVIEVDVVTQIRSTAVTSQIGIYDLITSPDSLLIEQASGRPNTLLYLQRAHGMLYRLYLDTSNRSIVSWARPLAASQFGTGPSLEGAVDMVLDRRPVANGRAVLVLVGAPNPKLLSVNLDSGDRTLVANIAAGEIDNYPSKLALDAANNRVILSNNETSSTSVDQIYALDLATGNLSTISDASDTGPTFTAASYMVLAPAVNPTRALAVDYWQPWILAIDLATGTRSLFDDGTAGTGVSYARAGPLFVDSARSRLLVANTQFPAHLFALPLAGGTRELVSGTNPATFAVRGSGPSQFLVSGIDVDVASDVAYVGSANNQSIMAIDLVSGDRVIVAR